MIVVKGLQSTQAALVRIDLALQRIRVNFINNFSKKVAAIAKTGLKPGKGIETGALQASIYSQITENDMFHTKAIVQAGDPNVSRGEGRFTRIITGPRSGQLASKSKTSEYAELVEGKYSYMQKAKDYAESKIMQDINVIIAVSLRGI